MKRLGNGLLYLCAVIVAGVVLAYAISWAFGTPVSQVVGG